MLRVSGTAIILLALLCAGAAVGGENPPKADDVTAEQDNSIKKYFESKLKRAEAGEKTSAAQELHDDLRMLDLVARMTVSTSEMGELEYYYHLVAASLKKHGDKRCAQMVDNLLRHPTLAMRTPASVDIPAQDLLLGIVDDLSAAWFHFFTPKGTEQERARFIFEHGFVGKKKGLCLSAMEAEKLLVSMGKNARKPIYKALLSEDNDLRWDNLHGVWCADRLIAHDKALRLTQEEKKRCLENGGPFGKAAVLHAMGTIEESLKFMEGKLGPLRAVALSTLQDRSRYAGDKGRYGKELGDLIVSKTVEFRERLPEITEDEPSRVFRMRRDTRWILGDGWGDKTEVANYLKKEIEKYERRLAETAESKKKLRVRLLGEIKDLKTVLEEEMGVEAGLEQAQKRFRAEWLSTPSWERPW
jgi:hypothetical protein